MDNDNKDNDTTNIPIREGFIDLQVGITKAFKRRYCVIYKTGVVDLYEKADKTKEPKASFHLQGGEEIDDKARIKNNRFRFKIITSSQKKWVFGCESESAQQEWIITFQNVLRAINALHKLHEIMSSPLADTMEGQLKIASALAECGQLSKARRIFAKLISKYGLESEEVHEVYESFLVKYCNDIHQAETHFIKRKKFFCLPKEFMRTSLGEQFKKISTRIEFLQSMKLKLISGNISPHNDEYQIEYRNIENIWPNYLYSINTKHLKAARKLVRKFLVSTNRPKNYQFEYSYHDIEQNAWYMIRQCVDGKSGAVRLEARLDAVVDSEIQKKLKSMKFAKLKSREPLTPISPTMISTQSTVSDIPDIITESKQNKLSPVPNNKQPKLLHHSQSSSGAASMVGDEVMGDILAAIDDLSDSSSDDNEQKQTQQQNQNNKLQPISENNSKFGYNDKTDTINVVNDVNDFIDELDIDIDDESDHDELQKPADPPATYKRATQALDDEIGDILDVTVSSNKHHHVSDKNKMSKVGTFYGDDMHHIFDSLSSILEDFNLNHVFPWTAFMLIWTMRRDSMLHIGGSTSHYDQLQCILEFVYLFTRGCFQELDAHWEYALLLLTLYNVPTERDHEDVKYKMCLSGVRVISDTNVTFENKYAVSKFMKAHKWLSIVKGQNKVLAMRKYFLKGVREELQRVNKSLNLFYSHYVYQDKNFKIISAISTKTKIATEINSQCSDKVQGRSTWGPRKQNTYDSSAFNLVCQHRQISPVPKPTRTPGNFDEAYMLFLLELAKELNPYFQQQVKIATKYTKCKHHAGSIKTENSCYNLMLHELASIKSPKSARILDYCNCTLSFNTISNLLSGYAALEDKFKICKIINFFQTKKLSNILNYKYMNVYILCKHPQIKFVRMVCEVRLTLNKVYQLNYQRDLIKECFGDVLHETEIRAIIKEVAQNKVPSDLCHSPKTQ